MHHENHTSHAQKNQTNPFILSSIPPFHISYQSLHSLPYTTPIKSSLGVRKSFPLVQGNDRSNTLTIDPHRVSILSHRFLPSSDFSLSHVPKSRWNQSFPKIHHKSPPILLRDSRSEPVSFPPHPAWPRKPSRRAEVFLHRVI